MRNFIFATEGAHDVSFIGKLLQRRGFKKITDFELLPMEWKPLFPKKFPWNGNSIERVARFPEVFHKDDQIVGLINSGGDSRLVSSLRNALDILVPENVERAIIFADADSQPAHITFDSLTNSLKSLNDQAQEEKAPGYPLSIPRTIGVLEGQNPEVAIFVFPNNNSQGILEDVLYECSLVSHPELAKCASDFVDNLNKSLDDKHFSLVKMRQGSNQKKSVMGAIANVLKPGSSLAVAVEQQKLIPRTELAPSVVLDIDKFVGHCVR